MQSDKRPPCQFVLMGFSEDRGSRRFAFDRVGTDFARTPFTVHADLNLIRLYGIHVQDLPLLCRALLERRADNSAERQYRFTEDDMRAYRVSCDEAARHTKRRRGFGQRSGATTQSREAAPSLRSTV